MQTEATDQWKELCKEIEGRSVGEAQVRSRGEGYKGRGEEPRKRGKKIGEQNWCRLASILKAFRKRKRSLRKKSFLRDQESDV